MLNVTVLFTIITLQSSDWNLDKKGTAIESYDPVSYFQGTPMEGDEDFLYKYRGANFYFSSEKNLNAFKEHPEKYIPQYGGYCAYAMGTNGEKVDINPKTFKIADGRLFLFYNSWGNNTLDPWNKDEQNLKERADKNWNQISTKDN